MQYNIYAKQDILLLQMGPSEVNL